MAVRRFLSNTSRYSLLVAASALLIVAGAALPGCERERVPRPQFATDDGQYLPRQTGPGLVPRQDSPIPEVPMPIGFKPVLDASESRYEGGQRWASHLYQGRAHTAELVLYYRQQLPRHGWRSDGRDEHDGRVELRYSRASESLNITITRRGSVVSARVELRPA